MKLDIRPRDLKIIQNILRARLPQSAGVWVFGSRAKQNAKRFSDLDLAVNTGSALSLHELAQLTSDFEASDLPYKIDVVNMCSISPAFKRLIDQDKIPLDFPNT